MWRKSSHRHTETINLPLRRIKKNGVNIYCKKMVLSVPKLENLHTRSTGLSHYPGKPSAGHRTPLRRTVEVRVPGWTSAKTFRKTVSCVCAGVCVCVREYLRMCTHMLMVISLYVYLCVCAWMCACMCYPCIYLCVPMCGSICMYVLCVCTGM